VGKHVTSPAKDSSVPGRTQTDDSKNRQWILAARPTGNLTGNEFRWSEALMRLFTGENFGKQLLRIVDQPFDRIW
jgi:hypothetical protein